MPRPEIPPPAPGSGGTGGDAAPRALLETLTGPARGQVLWLSAQETAIGYDDGRRLHTGGSDPAALFEWSGDTYEIAACAGHDIWINGRRTGESHLLHGDMIEFGEKGPMVRFRLCQGGLPTNWPVDEILSDAFAYARSSRRPIAPRLTGAFGETLRRILVQTTLAFRLTVLGILVALSLFLWSQYRRAEALRAALEEEALRLEAVAAALAETREAALDASDLADLRDRLDLRLDTNADRLAELERRSGAAARVIAEAAPSVLFLQGAYGLRHIESGKMLRHVLGDGGQPLVTPFGQPLVDPEGTGAPVEFQFTGTGFVLKGDGRLVSNRHVAEPWTSGERMAALEQSGMAPEMLRLLAYGPGTPAPRTVTLLAVAQDADLALLALAEPLPESSGLALAETGAAIGDEVIVMGYPTGLRALLAQAGRGFLATLQKEGETDFWAVARELSAAGSIAPLASRGIIAQITPTAVIYDAETTVGGSGGPALDRDGRVVAVNAAILPEFGGANIGVPVSELHRFLAGLPTD